MKIKIISLRKSGDKNIEVLEKEYLKRFKRFATVDLIDIKRKQITSRKSTRSDDYQKITAQIAPHEYCVLLSEKGKSLNTGEFTDLLKSIINGGYTTASFIIGGPSGYPEKLDSCVDKTIALSRMTFPHKIIRLLLIEALYRSFDIMKGGSYNK